MVPVHLMMFPVIDGTSCDLISHGEHLTHGEHHFLETWKTNYTFTCMGTLPFDRHSQWHLHQHNWSKHVKPPWFQVLPTPIHPIPHHTWRRACSNSALLDGVGLLCLDCVTMSCPVLFALSANHMIPRDPVLFVRYKWTVAVHWLMSIKWIWDRGFHHYLVQGDPFLSSCIP